MYDGASRAEEEKEVRIARGSREARDRRTQQLNYTVRPPFGAEVARLNLEWNLTPLARTGPVCVRTNERTNGRQPRLSIASSNNKTDDDELPFHLLQHGRQRQADRRTYTSATVSVHGWQSLGSRVSRPRVSQRARGLRITSILAARAPKEGKKESLRMDQGSKLLNDTKGINSETLMGSRGLESLPNPA